MPAASGPARCQRRTSRGCPSKNCSYWARSSSGSWARPRFSGAAPSERTAVRSRCAAYRKGSTASRVASAGDRPSFSWLSTLVSSQPTRSVIRSANPAGHHGSAASSRASSSERSARRVTKATAASRSASVPGPPSTCCHPGCSRASEVQRCSPGGPAAARSGRGITTQLSMSLSALTPTRCRGKPCSAVRESSASWSATLRPPRVLGPPSSATRVLSAREKRLNEPVAPFA